MINGLAGWPCDPAGAACASRLTQPGADPVAASFRHCRRTYGAAGRVTRQCHGKHGTVYPQVRLAMLARMDASCVVVREPALPPCTATPHAVLHHVRLLGRGAG